MVDRKVIGVVPMIAEITLYVSFVAHLGRGSMGLHTPPTIWNNVVQ